VNAVCLSQTATKVLLRLMLCLAKTAFELTVVSTLKAILKTPLVLKMA
jgi:hypothetical protein